jgi:hypothetical protein
MQTRMDTLEDDKGNHIMPFTLRLRIEAIAGLKHVPIGNGQSLRPSHTARNVNLHLVAPMTH